MKHHSAVGCEDIFWIENKKEIDLLLIIAQSISAKHKRTFVMNYFPHYEEDDSHCHKVRNEVVRFVEKNTKFSRKYFYEDGKFRKKLQSNIKNHLPTDIYNYLLYRAAENQNKPKECHYDIHKKILSLTAYRVLHLLCQTLYEDLYKQTPMFHDRSYPGEVWNRFGIYLKVNKTKNKLILLN